MKYPWIVRILSIILFVTGFCINYIIARRRFKRRAITGLEGFKSYERAWLITLTEKFGKLIGIILIIAGIVVFIITYG